MIQNILVYMIIAATLAYVVFSIVNNLRTQKEDHCGGCDGCSVKNEFRKTLEHKRKYNRTVNTREIKSFSIGNSPQNGIISLSNKLDES